MRGQISVISIVIFIFSGHILLAQQCGLAKIDTADLKRHLQFIASDELQGRCPGTPGDGLNRAADYIAEQVRQLGLAPGAPNYFQSVDMVAMAPDSANFAAVVDGHGNTRYRTQAVVELKHADQGSLYSRLPVVFVGFGENIEAIDVKGKAVMMALGTRDEFLRRNFRWNNRLEEEKINALAARQPQVIFLVSSPWDYHHNTFQQLQLWHEPTRFALAGQLRHNAVETMLVLPEFADALLGRKRSYRRYLLRFAERGDSAVCVPNDKYVTVKTGQRETTVDTKNVVALLPGSDPELQNEYVVFMAHYDHLGIDESGEVYNGADDNGSGTVSIMEVAEAFASLDPEPKRSLVFLWVTGEEIGKLGSEYYTSNPVVPLERTVACINLDMVGRVYEPRDSVWKNSPKMVKDFDGLYTLSNSVWPALAQINLKVCQQLELVPDTTLPAPFLRSSDHYHFHKNGIPVLNYATGYHADYHEVGDEVEKINFVKMKRVAELCFLVGFEVANYPQLLCSPADQ